MQTCIKTLSSEFWVLTASHIYWFVCVLNDGHVLNDQVYKVCDNYVPYNKTIYLIICMWEVESTTCIISLTVLLID